MTFRHRINQEEFDLALDLANMTVEVFSKRPGHYNNNLNSHLRGKVGEIAASAALAAGGVETVDLWTEMSSIAEADIYVPSRFRADVKTWDGRYWLEMGRCVAHGQLPKLRAKADGIIWCSSDSQLEPGMMVEVVGWNRMTDVADAPRRFTGPPGGRQVDNYQIELSAVRDLQSLFDHLRS